MMKTQAPDIDSCPRNDGLQPSARPCSGQGGGRHGTEESAENRRCSVSADLDQRATTLMVTYRDTRSHDAFEALINLTHDQLLQRVRVRSRSLGGRVDPQELLQDAFINMFRYPSRFDGSKPSAFRVWSSAIVDNAIRRHMRQPRSGPEISLQPTEILAQEPSRISDPGLLVVQNETCAQTAVAYRVFLQVYLAAYERLSSRERFVLRMVEVKGLRYARIGELIGARSDAVKMIVFRGRQRIFKHIEAILLADDCGESGGR